MPTPDDTSDFDQLWDYDDPAASEQRFRVLLLRIAAGTPAYLELVTQIARAQGLQRDFEAAHSTVRGGDEAEMRESSPRRLVITRPLRQRCVCSWPNFCL